MPVCQSCGEKWTWKQTIKTLFRLRCPHCGEKQYESAASRQKSGVFMIIPLALMPIVVWLDVSVSTALFLAIIISFIILALHPFILKLSNDVEPFW